MNESTRAPVEPAESASVGRPEQRSAGGTGERGESPLRVKLVLLASISLVTGVVIGLAEAALSDRGWPVMLAMGFALIGMWSLAQTWVLAPMERLLQQAERLAASDGEADAPRRLRQLPVKREDEVGRLARCLHRLGASAAQAQQEARALRRDMHSQVAQSTQRATNELRRIAHRDPLTDLGNRRNMDDTLPELLSRAQESGRDVLCVLIDVDNFKEVNDTLGHARGDEALRCLGQLLDGSVRPGDLAVRLGGDEFALFLPGATLDRVEGLAEQVRTLFRQRMRSLLGKACWADLSIGVASMRREGCRSGEELLSKADEHLYQAKHGGKGRCYGVSEPQADPDTPLIRRSS